MKRVLVVDPEKVSANLYQSVLTAAGFSVKSIDSAEAALRLLDKWPVDAVVLELDIADHNGMEFLYELITYSDWRELPVVVQTTVPISCFDKMKVAWRELNVVNYLYKAESSLADLQTAVRAATERLIADPQR